MKTYGPEYEAWLATLKVGDTWRAIMWRHGNTAAFTITGETKKQWKVGTSAYWKNSGRQVGHGSDLPPPATEQELADLRGQIRQHHMSQKLSTVRWQDVSLETLTAIDAILSQSKED